MLCYTILCYAILCSYRRSGSNFNTVSAAPLTLTASEPSPSAPHDRGFGTVVERGRKGEVSSPAIRGLRREASPFFCLILNRVPHPTQNCSERFYTY